MVLSTQRYEIVCATDAMQLQLSEDGIRVGRTSQIIPVRKDRNMVEVSLTANFQLVLVSVVPFRLLSSVKTTVEPRYFTQRCVSRADRKHRWGGMGGGVLIAMSKG